jgi:hypothetical protein
VRCLICGSEDRVRRFAVTVDGEPLRLRSDLCGDHGDGYLFRVGQLMGEYLRENGQSGHSIPRPSRWSAEEVADFRARAQAELPLSNTSGHSGSAYDSPLYCQCSLDFHPTMRSPEGVTLCRHCEKPMRPGR